MSGRLYKFTHIVTVGTSILRNALAEARQGNRLLEPHVDVLEAVVGAPPGREEAHINPASRVFEDLLSFVEYDPRGASAELNAFLGFISDRRFFPRRIPEGVEVEHLHRVVLYHTDTHAGWVTSRLIRGFLSTAKLPEGHMLGVVEERQIDGLGRDFQPGLLNLVSTLVSDIERYRRDSVVFLNLTGGFKPESGYALIAASLAGAARAYYIHELTRETVTIPLLGLHLAEGTCRLFDEIVRVTERRGKPKHLEDPYRVWAYRMGLSDIYGVPNAYARVLVRTLRHYCS